MSDGLPGYGAPYTARSGIPGICHKGCLSGRRPLTYKCDPSKTFQGRNLPWPGEIQPQEGRLGLVEEEVAQLRRIVHSGEHPSSSLSEAQALALRTCTWSPKREKQRAVEGGQLSLRRTKPPVGGAAE